MAKRLKLLIYQALQEQPHTGYSLVKHIEERTGWKPSWGSMYPALEQLRTEKHIVGKEQKNSTVYTLTAAGKKYSQQTHNEHKELIQGIIERMKILSTIVEEDMSVPIAYLEELKEGSNPFIAIQKESERMKKELYRLWKEDKMQKKKTVINSILKQANKELRAL